jgi:hypothetical protein
MDLNEEIARVAYELWEKRGRGPDKDQEDWNTAESIVRAQHGQPGAGTGEAAEEESIKTEKTASKEASEKSANGKAKDRSKRRKSDGSAKK